MGNGSGLRILFGLAALAVANRVLGDAARSRADRPSPVTPRAIAASQPVNSPTGQDSIPPRVLFDSFATRLGAAVIFLVPGLLLLSPLSMLVEIYGGFGHVNELFMSSKVQSEAWALLLLGMPLLVLGMVFFVGAIVIMPDLFPARGFWAALRVATLIIAIISWMMWSVITLAVMPDLTDAVSSLTNDLGSRREICRTETDVIEGDACIAALNHAKRQVLAFPTLTP